MKNVLVLLALLAGVFTQAQTRGVRDQNVPAERLYVDLSKVPLSPENEKAFVSFYRSFIEVHAVDDEGEIIPGKGLPDEQETKLRLLHYVAQKNPEFTVRIGRRCKACLGNSKVWVKVEPNDPLSFAKMEIDCPDCPSDGLIETEVTYRFIFTSHNLPPLPEKPRVVKHRALVVKALAGDVQSQVEYAAMLEDGTSNVGKDEELAKDLYSRALVGGSMRGLEGLLRMEQKPRAPLSSQPRFPYVLQLVQAKLSAEDRERGIFEVNPDRLAVAVPQGLSYIEAKIAELEARTLLSNFNTKDLKLGHLGKNATRELLAPLKAQMEKHPPVSARAKVEFVLLDLALSAETQVIGGDRLALLKQAAISLDPVAFGMLADIGIRGLNGGKNLQSAAIFLVISLQLQPSNLARSKLESLDSRYDRKVCTEMLDEFNRTKINGKANPYFIDAVLKFNSLK